MRSADVVQHIQEIYLAVGIVLRVHLEADADLVAYVVTDCYPILGDVEI